FRFPTSPRSSQQAFISPSWGIWFSPLPLIWLLSICHGFLERLIGLKAQPSLIINPIRQHRRY
ncbi:MAG: hypothetical protein ABSA46_21530, partial [Thermodesulfovibrionales bacterium]